MRYGAKKDFPVDEFGEGQFMVSGRNLHLRRRFKPEMF